MPRKHTGQGAYGAINWRTHQKFIADRYRKITQKALGATDSRNRWRTRSDGVTLSLGSQP